MVLELLPCIKKLWLVAPTVRALVGVIVLAVKVPVTVAPPLRLAAPATANVPVKLAALEIVWPFTVPTTVIFPAGVTLKRLAPFSCKSIRLPVPAALVLFTSNIGLEAWLEVTVRRAKVGVAVVLISCAVLITPLAAEKFVLLNCAIPFWLVEASLRVIVPPEPLALATVTTPVWLLILVTPPLPGQDCQVGAPAVETRHCPGAPATKELIALVPLPKRTPLVVRETAPVPPWTTLSAVVKPESDVISLLAPLEAAPKLERAPDAVLAPVPPLVTAKGVLKVVVPVTLRLPLTVTIDPSSLISESPITCPAVNLASWLVVPPAVVTAPPIPVQLPTVVHTSYVPAAAVCKR